MGTALSTTGNKHHTPCLIGVATSPLNPHPPHLVMGSSAEENDGVRVCFGGEQCVYSSGAHCICRRMMRVCALECMCVCMRAHAGASVCVRVCEYLRGFVVCRCVTKCVCVHACACANVCVYACMYQRLCMCVCPHVLVCAHMCECLCAFCLNERMLWCVSLCVHVCMCV